MDEQAQHSGVALELDRVMVPLDFDGDDAVDPALPSRQCGRCRKTFAGDSTAPPGVMTSWWLCAPCRTSLLGGDVRTHRAD